MVVECDSVAREEDQHHVALFDHAQKLVLDRIEFLDGAVGNVKDANAFLFDQFFECTGIVDSFV